MSSQEKMKSKFYKTVIMSIMVGGIFMNCQPSAVNDKAGGSNSIQTVNVAKPSIDDLAVLNDFGLAEDSTAEIENPALNYGSKSISFENEDDAGQFPGGIGKRASKSGHIAISTDDQLVVTANPDSNSIAIFNARTFERTALLTTGNEPTAVVINPDSKTAYVANRADATVVKINNIDTSNPTLGEKANVGSEPTGLALSPTGFLLFVAEWGQGRVSVIDTRSMKVRRRLHAPAQPYAIAVTNNGNRRDDDEVVVITEFFGRVKPGGAGETKDDGRIGQVLFYRVGDLTQFNRITFQPVETGFATALKKLAGQKHFASPNQHYSAGIWGEKVYVTSISASPEADQFVKADGTNAFFQPFGNVFPVVYIGNLNKGTEDRSGAGSGNLTKQILAKFSDPVAPDANVSFIGDIVDIEFSPKESKAEGAAVGYVLSRGGDVLQRVTWNSGAGTTDLGLRGDIKPISLNPGNGKKCQNPLGVAIDLNSNKAYVNCWVSRTMAVIDLKTQEVLATPATAAPPKGPDEIAVNKGARFFYTGTGRWSKNSVSSCASCHSDGLTDNITWAFNAGPRQSVSLDGSFSKGPDGVKKQRIFNWSGIFDEIHDFERNTRGVQGGFGAITQPKAGNDDQGIPFVCKNATTEQQKDIAPLANLGKPMRELQDALPTCPADSPRDWDAIEAWIKQIRPPHARHIGSRGRESAARGRELFIQGKCNSCHGGSGWTVSRRFWEPKAALNADLDKIPFTRPANFPENLNASQTFDTFATQFSVDNFNFEGKGKAGVKSVACVIRNVGTYGIRRGDGSLDFDGTKDFELQVNRGNTAAGNFGFNVPSLYGLGTGAPYFHHGLAATLDDVVADPRWNAHLTAGNRDFLKNVSDEELIQARRDLKRFLLSIDSKADEVPLPAEADLCPKVCLAKENCI